MTTSTPRSPSAPVSIVGISGSLRRDSTNTALLRTAATLAPEGVRLRIAPLADVPFYNGDLERAEGFPSPVAALRRAVAAADGLLLASPEYNWSTSGVLKNAIDWLSRGPDAPLDELPTALVSAAGGSGGSRAQDHLHDILAHNRVRVVDASLLVPRARRHVEDGELVTPELRDQLTRVVDALLAEITAARAAA